MLSLATASGAAAQTPESASPPVVDEGALPAPEADSSAPSDPSSASMQAAGVTDIVVTGSRIRRQDYSSATPIVTLSAESLDRSSAGIVSDALNQLPQITAPNNNVSSAAGRAGRSTVDLRGLGAQRTLVLLDGRRVQPSTADGTIDINFLPSALIEQVEVITGGASSVYGSDAMAGVVNFILRKNVEGIELHGQYNAPEIGAGSSYDFGLIGGHSFGNARFLFAVNRTVRTRAVRSARDYWQFSQTSAILDRPVFNFSSNAPSQAAVNGVFGGYGAAPGLVRPTSRLAVNEDQTLFTQTQVGSPIVNYRGQLGRLMQIDGDSVVRNNGLTYDVIVPIRRTNVFGRFDYDFSPETKAFVQVLFSRTNVSSQSTDTGPGTNGTNAFLPATNPFIPADLRTLLDSRANPDAMVPFQLMLTQLGPSTVNSRYDVFQAVAGLSGKIFDNSWNWDLYATYGRSTGRARQIGGSSLAAIQTLLEAPDGGVGLCDGGFNVFGPTDSFSQSCLDYISRSAYSTEALDQQVVEGSLEGPLLSLPAGEVRLAVGADYRRTSFATSPDPQLGTGDFVGSMASFPSRGSQRAAEIYGELYIPLIHDVPLIRELSVDVGGRYSNYSNFGGATTYKADVEWSLTRWFKVRGGYARAIRAPSLSELYSATTPVNATIGGAAPGAFTGDPCDIRTAFRTGPNGSQVRALCIAQGVPAEGVDSYTYPTTSIFGATSGNPGLKPEVGNTYTVGVILRSPFATPLLSGFTASIDYYNIRIKGAIGQLPITTTLARCFNADGSNPNYSADNFYCQFIGRNAVGSLAGGTVVPTLNLASYRTSGIDLQVDWTINLRDLAASIPGRLGVNFVGNYLDRFVVQPLSGTVPIDYAGYSEGAITSSVLPKWRSNMDVSYSLDQGEVGVRWRHFGTVADISRATSSTSTARGVSARDYFDLHFAVNVVGGLSFFGGINNLFDQDPPQVGSRAGFSTDIATYDTLGRTYFFGVRATY